MVFYMNVLERLTDVKKSVPAKVIAVLVSVAMVLSLTNMSAFAEGNGYEGEIAPVEQSVAVEITVKAEHATVSMGTQSVSNNPGGKTVVVESKQPLSFTVIAQDATYKLETVEAIAVDENGVEKTTQLIANADGKYVIPENQITSDLVISAKATLIDGQSTTTLDSGTVVDPANNANDQASTDKSDTSADRVDQNTLTSETNNEQGSNPSQEIIHDDSLGFDIDNEGNLTNAKSNDEAVNSDETNSSVEKPTEQPNFLDQVGEFFSGIFGKTSTMSASGDVIGGSGTEADPYIVNPGATIKISGTKNDDKKWKIAEGHILKDQNVNWKKEIDNTKLDKLEKDEVTLIVSNLVQAEKGFTIRHKIGREKYEYFYITVQTTQAETGYYVYVYTDVTGDTSGLTLNGQGWYTLGKLFVEGINNPKNQSDEYQTSGNDFNAVMEALKNPEKNFEAYSQNTSIDLKSVNWTKYGLKRCDGASDYSAEAPSGTHTWHLDGIVDVTSFGEITYKYIDSVTKQEIYSSKTIVGKSGTSADSNEQKINIDGYTYQSAEPATATFEKGNPKTVNLYYKKNTYALTTQADEHSTIAQGYEYQYDPQAALDAVTFAANTGYHITGVTVDNVALAGDELTAAINAGKVENLSKTGNHSVSVTSEIRQDLTYTVNYLEYGTNNVLAPQAVVPNQTFDTTVDVNAIAIDGYVLIGEPTQQVTISADEAQNVINFYYGVDNVSTDPANPGSSDGVPDMYQVPVNFTAVNGAASFPVTYVTLYDADGNYAVDGTGYLTANQIATATANAGYDQASLAWNVTPSTTTPITSEVTYTATFTATPVVPVVPIPTPAPAGPGAPAVAPGVPTPAAAAAAAPLAAPVATITDDATPLAAGETINDEDTPLAAFDHVDCWVHWFILVGIILTAIYGAVVVRRRLAVVKDVDDLENEVLDGAVAGSTQSAPADNRQAI